MSGGNEAYAEIDYIKAKNERGFMHDCVVATCTASGDKTEPVWGHGPRSVKRALATLSQNCSCGARWHEAADPDDVEEIEPGSPNDPFGHESSTADEDFPDPFGEGPPPDEIPF